MFPLYRHVWPEDTSCSSLHRTDNERVVHERVNTVPFVLAGTDEAEVRVLCPLQATGTHTEVTYEEFHQANYGLGDIVGQFFSGEKLKGQLEIEEMLKVSCWIMQIPVQLAV